MSSTTDTDQRGQILVLFAGGAIAFLLVAALAFDVGMMLVERRDEQNAADAAALAGARFVLDSANYSGTCASAPASNKAVTAACDVATANGFDDTASEENVIVHVPPEHGRYVGFPGFIEVQIDATRPSIFAGVIGRAAWPVGVFAVAANQQNLTFPFSMLALNETKCKAMQFTGAGVVEAYANIHSNSTGSDCTGDPISISRTGGATVDIYADDATCRAVGEIQDQGSGYMTCKPAERSFMLPDPLRFLPYPTQPTLPTTAMAPVGHTQAPPDYCPGAPAANRQPSLSSPRLCDVGGNGAAYANLAWILYPGLYPGGIQVSNGATAYLMPGIYWIGGGGFRTTTGGSVITIETEEGASSSPASATWGGGVLIFNSKLQNEAAGAISLGGSGASLKLKPHDAPDGSPLEIYDDIVIFQDRSVTETVTLNGAASTTQVEGIIYVPEGLVKLNGNGGTLIVDQIIADSYLIDGNNGTIQVLRNTGVDAVITGVGLVD